jgi:DNA-binding response OmpR family regulator
MEILVVEDEPLTRKVVEFLLIEAGYKVTTASTLEAADLYLKQHVPVLVLIDKILPDGDGIEYCKKLSVTEPDLPVIMLTCESRLVDRIEGMKNADDYIIKPFGLKQLVKRIRQLLGQENESIYNKTDMSSRFLKVGNAELALKEGVLRLPLRPAIPLNTMELKILHILMLNSDTLVSLETLKVAIDNVATPENQVEDCIIGLRRKIELNPLRSLYLQQEKDSYRFSKVQQEILAS